MKPFCLKITGAKSESEGAELAKLHFLGRINHIIII
jgi:hypothetical protein